MSTPISFHEVHLSDAIEGVSATAREGVFTYRIFVAAEALLELGATRERTSWMPTFLYNLSRIGPEASAAYRARPGAAVVIATFATN